MKIVIMGAPSSGKGIQAKLIEDKYGLKHISTGQILRDFVQSGTPEAQRVKIIINNGDLIDDATMCKIVAEKLECEKDNYVLDGFPRTKKQTEFLIKNYCPNFAFYLNTSVDVALDRVLNRLVCPVCKKSYNKKDLKNYVCSNDKANLVVRDDDTPEIFLKRFKTFEKENKPILNLFKKAGVLREIANDGDISTSFEQIKLLIDNSIGEMND